MNYCPYCGIKIIANTVCCPACGKRLVSSDSISAKSIHQSNIVKYLVIFLIVTCIFTSLCFVLHRNKTSKIDTSTIVESMPPLNFSDNPTAISSASQSVVKLSCYDSKNNLIASGSGFSTFEKGVIVTNFHVIADQPSKIIVSTENGQSFDIAGGIGFSAEQDIVILYYHDYDNAINLPLLEIGSTSLEKGEKVVAIGSPLGLTNSVSVGIFSGYNNESNSASLQFTAAISHGSSGGALFNNSGEVIGITSASYENAQNLNLAIPIDLASALFYAERNDRSSLDSFNHTIGEYYDSLLPHYSVNYIFEHSLDVENAVFWVDGWVSSYRRENGCYTIYITSSNEEVYDLTEIDNEKRFKADQKRFQNGTVLRVEISTTDPFDALLIDLIKTPNIGTFTSLKCTGISFSSNIPYANLSF